jgi:hypothetical protein
MRFLAANWILIAVVMFLAMHRSGMGCGTYGSHHQNHQAGKPGQDRTGRKRTNGERWPLVPVPRRPGGGKAT